MICSKVTKQIYLFPTLPVFHNFYGFNLAIFSSDIPNYILLSSLYHQQKFSSLLDGHQALQNPINKKYVLKKHSNFYNFTPLNMITKYLYKQLSLHRTATAPSTLSRSSTLRHPLLPHKSSPPKPKAPGTFCLGISHHLQNKVYKHLYRFLCLF